MATEQQQSDHFKDFAPEPVEPRPRSTGPPGDDRGSRGVIRARDRISGQSDHE